MCAGPGSAAVDAGRAARRRKDTQRHGARARARAQRAARAERAPIFRALRGSGRDMDALSDDDEYARREPQVFCCQTRICLWYGR